MQTEWIEGERNSSVRFPKENNNVIEDSYNPDDLPF